ncbi:hypothetical protein C8F01DRAFT_1260450 [Mycena amicta]|nr:hypothetical protein C8F01DRAFT_1260450 [Mycena amicta]
MASNNTQPRVRRQVVTQAYQDAQEKDDTRIRQMEKEMADIRRCQSVRKGALPVVPDDDELEEEEPTMPTSHKSLFGRSAIAGETYTPQPPVDRVPTKRRYQDERPALRNRTNDEDDLMTFDNDNPLVDSSPAARKRKAPNTAYSPFSDDPASTPPLKRTRKDGLGATVTRSAGPEYTTVDADAGSASGAGDPNAKVPPPFAVNYNPGPKPKAEDYAAGPYEVIVAAGRTYEAAILTEAAFPRARAASADDAGEGTAAGLAAQMPLVHELVERCWEEANRGAGTNYLLTTAIKRIIKGRGSRIRGEIVRSYRMHDDPSKKTKKRNAALYTTLLAGQAYRHKDVIKSMHLFENKTAIAILRQACFNNGSKSFGVVHEESFMPISFQTLALVYTMIQFCIEEWKTGTCVKHDFDEKTVAPKYFAMLSDVMEWDSVDPGFSHKLRTKWAKSLRKGAGVADEAQGEEGFVTEDIKDKIRREQEGRTGDTDSEGEENEEDSEDD